MEGGESSCELWVASGRGRDVGVEDQKQWPSLSSPSQNRTAAQGSRLTLLSAGSGRGRPQLRPRVERPARICLYESQCCSKRYVDYVLCVTLRQAARVTAVPTVTMISLDHRMQAKLAALA